MDDPRASEGVEHLQVAAQELLAAARLFLDVAEEVVSDPERFSGAASGLVELFRDGLVRAEQPWQRMAPDEQADDSESDRPSRRSGGDRGKVTRIAVD